MEEINEYDVTRALTDAGLKWRDGSRYIVSCCPFHAETNPSAQIFKDDWFVNCLAGCGRQHITKAFPELRTNGGYRQPIQRRPKIESIRNYKTFDLTEAWGRLPLIPRNHDFKKIPLRVLDDLGWRWDAAKGSYFIPYFSVGKRRIPFAQWRHLTGSRRFTFLAGARPTLYGKWNIQPGGRLFIVEGASDSAVLENASVPWIGVPSASSGTILANFAKAAQEMGVSLVYAGDNDQAGEALREALDGTSVPYRVCQPPTKYKDWGEFQEAEGAERVLARCLPKLFE